MNLIKLPFLDSKSAGTVRAVEIGRRAASTYWPYVGAVLVLSYSWQLVLYFTGGIDSRLFPILMLFPGMVAIVFRLFAKEGFGDIGWGLRRWWYAIPAVIIPAIVISGIGVLLLRLHWATWSSRIFLFEGGTVQIRELPLWLGARKQSIALFAVSFVLSLLLQSVFGGVVTIGEELGWRGHLQEKLLKRFGLNRGLVLLGIIWGFWHLPIGLMGWNFPDRPVVGAIFLTPLSTVFMGVYLGWLYLRSRSIWMPTVAHAAMNLSASVLFVELDMRQGKLPLQLSWIAAWGIVAAICLISLNRTRQILWQAADSSAGDSQGAHGRRKHA